MADIIFLEAVDHSSQRVKGVASPQAGTDAANRDYVDNAVRGLAWKPEVVAASTTNVSLSAPGSTLDGVTLSAGMQVVPNIGTVTRILLKDQTAPAENGIYDWNGAASALTRSVDADSWAELAGSTVTVQQGTVNADRVYNVTANEGGTLGTTAVTLAQVGGGSGVATSRQILAGTGLTGGGDLSADRTLSIDTSVVTRKATFNVGNGSSTNIDLVHSFGTRDVQVTVYRNSSPWEELHPGKERLDTNTVRLTFPTAPTTNQYRAVVQG